MDFGLESNAIEQDIISDMKQYFPPDTPEEDILELYRNPDKFQTYINQLETYYAEEYKNYSIYNQCIIPVLEQSFASIWVLLFLCLVLRLLCITKLPRNIIHVISFIFGCISLWKFYEGDMVYVLVPAVITMLLCKLVRIPGLLLTVMAGSLMLASENYFLSPIVWTKIKGSVMMISMKIISISFDEESGDPDKVIPFLEYFGYVFNPASVIFGPFITHQTYQQMFMHSNISLNWLFNCCQVLVTAVACLLWSSCGSSNYLANIEDYVPGLRGNRWWKAYQEAQQFRFSHYFSCYLSEASILLVGIGTLTPNVKSSKENKKKKEQTIQWRSPVTSLMMVEFPRSLVDVVTNWNLPVHYWLKQYIFKSTRKYGVFAAILITYVASSMLHAFNFQLSAVLLSIGVFAYVEASFRHLLAVWFNACIEARKCRGKCTHKYNKNNFFVMAVNLMFSMVAVWNLAYLGCLFDASEEEDKGYSMKHALKKWQGYNYTNHLVMLVVLVFQKLSGLFVRTD